MFFIYLALFTFLIFAISYWIEPRRLLNGFLFNLFLLTFLMAFAYLDLASQNIILIFLFLVLAFFGLIILLFGGYILIFAFLWNAKIVMKHERRTPANLLTLFIALGLITHIIWHIIKTNIPLPDEINIFLSGFSLIAFYYFIGILNFLSISFVYHLKRPSRNLDYMIILGSGIIGEKVPPLLASRINKAIEIYHRQQEKNQPPILIFSGGQGPNEDIPEALAMQRYAISQGIPIEDTLLENKSRNTLQNMRFSKKIMDDRHPNGYRSIFVTNNFHAFRASLYAKQTGLNSQVIGSKTARYFLPNALIREYIAIVVMDKKRHIIINGLILLSYLLLAIIEHFIFS